MIDIKLVPESEMKSMCRLLADKIIAHYQIPENQKRFEERCLKKYGRIATDASYMRKNDNSDSTRKEGKQRY